MKTEYNNEIDMLCRKGFCPYEWMDDNEKLNYDGLPSIDNFYSTLKKENITEEDYNHAKNVYEQLKCTSFKDYHDIFKN